MNNIIIFFKKIILYIYSFFLSYPLHRKKNIEWSLLTTLKNVCDEKEGARETLRGLDVVR